MHLVVLLAYLLDEMLVFADPELLRSIWTLISHGYLKRRETIFIKNKNLDDILEVSIDYTQIEVLSLGPRWHNGKA